MIIKKRIKKMVAPTIVLPTLSTDGWVSDFGKMLDYLFSYYVLTDINQTYVFKGELKSISEAYYLYMHEPTNLANKIESDFNFMLSQYFTDSNIKCYAKQDTINLSLYNIFLSAVVMDINNVKHNLNVTLSLANGKSFNVIKHNNYSDSYSTYLTF